MTAPTRRARAQQTRTKIVQAAHQEFLASGYHGATVAAIARRAGVAAQTVYFVFHTKSALISAAIEAAVLGPDETAPEDTEWWAAMVASESGHEALSHFVRGAGPVYARAARVGEVLRAAASTDAECRATWLRYDHMQMASFRQVVDLVGAKTPLRPGLDPASATDVLITVFGDATYDLFTTVRGWSDARTLAWMVDSVPLLLLGDPVGPAGR